jgi:hypothetical protein
VCVCVCVCVCVRPGGSAMEMAKKFSLMQSCLIDRSVHSPGLMVWSGLVCLLSQAVRASSKVGNCGGGVFRSLFGAVSEGRAQVKQAAGAAAHHAFDTLGNYLKLPAPGMTVGSWLVVGRYYTIRSR